MLLGSAATVGITCATAAGVTVAVSGTGTVAGTGRVGIAASGPSTTCAGKVVGVVITGAPRCTVGMGVNDTAGPAADAGAAGDLTRFGMGGAAAGGATMVAAGVAVVVAKLAVATASTEAEVAVAARVGTGSGVSLGYHATVGSGVTVAVGVAAGAAGAQISSKLTGGSRSAAPFPAPHTQASMSPSLTMPLDAPILAYCQSPPGARRQ